MFNTWHAKHSILCQALEKDKNITKNEIVKIINDHKENTLNSKT